MAGYGVLAGLLGGFGGFGQQVGGAMEAQRKDALERDRLAIEQQRADQLLTLQQNTLEQQRSAQAQNQSQFEAKQAAETTPVVNLFKYIGMPVPESIDPSQRVPTAMADKLIAGMQEQQKAAREQALNTKTGAFLQQAKGTPGVEPPDEGAMYSAGTPATPPLSKWDTAAGLAALGHKDAGLTTLMNMLYPANKFAPLAEGATGIFNTESGVPTLFDRPSGGPPEARPGFEIETTTDKNGRVSYHEKRITSGVDHDALARERGYGSFAQAPQDVQRAINVQIKQDRVDVSNAQGAGALAQRPLSDQEQSAISAHNTILSSIAQLKQFSPAEIAAYTGLLNRPVANVKNALAGLGIIDADRRFNEFKPIMGRLQGTAFGEGGKQLTGIELQVVSNYTPTGNEPGGAPEVQAKVRNLEAFTKISRDARLYMAKTGRGAVDADQLDGMIRDKMQQAGMPIPKPAAGWESPTAGRTPPPVAGPNQLSRQDPLYQHARARGMTDQQIQTKYGITLVP